MRSVELFWGRPKEVAAIVASINHPGQHAILFGDRGVGKSSLANIVALLLKDSFGGHTYTVRCDSMTTFASLATTIIADLKIQRPPSEVVQTRKFHGGGSAGILGVAASIGSETQTSETHLTPALDTSPSAICRLLVDRDAFFVIDEFDAINSPTDRHLVAELIKQLSDSGSELKLLVVGIGVSASDLLAGHPSVHRHLKEIALGRMAPREVVELINGNNARSGQTFAPQVVQDIVTLSDGFPYFAQLLGLKCAEIAVKEKRSVVALRDLPRALRSAADDAEATLQDAYTSAIRSKETNIYELILKALASFETVEVTAQALRQRIQEIAGRAILPHEVANALKRLANQEGTMVLRRVSRGIYRFSDPRMKVYVRILVRAVQAQS